MNKPSTKYLEYLTDDFGVWQHASETEINKKEGYALDDAARALIVYIIYGNLDKAKICLEYISQSLKDGKFIGFFNEQRESIVYPSSYDAAALAVLALCFAINSAFEVDKCKNILKKIDYKMFNEHDHLRQQAYLVIANSLYSIPEIADYHEEFSSKFNRNNWFEEKLTYANAIMPLALIEYNLKNPLEKKLTDIIKSSITTLEKHMRIGVIPAPIGNREWHIMGDLKRDVYGQQAIDASFMVIMLCKAYELFKDKIYYEKAKEWMEWFYGNNIFKQSLIKEDSACCDGIDEKGLSRNYGAESTIVYLWANKTFENTKV